MATQVSNLATVQGIYDAFGRGDMPHILDQLADGVHWESWSDNHAQKAGVPWLQGGRGKEAAMAFFSFVGQWQFHSFSAVSFMEGGNQVAVEFVIDTTVTQTGKRMQDEEVHLWTFDEQGRVTRFRHYVDTAKHIAASQA
jgi:ketosteroid isomerase-like protein